MLSLKDSESFRKEYLLYKAAIETIEVESARERGFSLLTKLCTYCNLIDEGHNSRNNGYIDPRSLRDNITELVEIRKELAQLAKDSKIK
jgi:hypothetical protein